MKKVIVTKNNTIVFSPILPESEVAAYVAAQVAADNWGKKAWTEHKLITPAIPRHVSEDGLTIIEAVPAVYEDILHPAEYSYEIVDVVEDVTAKLIEDGKRGRLACEAVLDFVAGHNRSSGKTLEQIMAMRSVLEVPESLLRAGMPATAKGAIAALVVDGEIITESLKSGALALLADF